MDEPRVRCALRGIQHPESGQSWTGTVGRACGKNAGQQPCKVGISWCLLLIRMAQEAVERREYANQVERDLSLTDVGELQPQIEFKVKHQEIPLQF